MPYNKLVSQRLFSIKYERNQNVIFLGHVLIFLNNIGFPTKGKLLRSNSVLVSMRFRIQRKHHLNRLFPEKLCSIPMEKRGKGGKVSVGRGGVGFGIRGAADCAQKPNS